MATLDTLLFCLTLSLMLTRDAFELGYCSAAAGSFFDSMELLAALSVSCGGFDRLEAHVQDLVHRQRADVHDQLRFVTELCSAAFRTPIPLPVGVDDYRNLLTGAVFEIVNRWSYIADIRQVNQLQGWFYAGFGLGRIETVTAGTELFLRLRDDLGALLPPLDQTPSTLARMSTEAARQLATAAQEHELDRVRDELLELVPRADALAIHLQGDPRAVAPGALTEELRRRASQTLRHLRLDLVRS